MRRAHKELDVWKLSMELAKDIFRIVDTFPKKELFGLSLQMKRCALSIPSNIAEGAGRKTKKDFRNFLYIAQGSLNELDTQVEIAYSLGYISKNVYNELEEKILRVGQMIAGLIKKQTQRINNEKK